MRTALLVSIVLLIVLGACNTNQVPSNSTEIPIQASPIPTQTPFLTDPTIAPLPAEATVEPTKPSTSTPVPQTLEEWARSNNPDPKLLQSSLATYAQSMGIAVESIQTEVQLRNGVNGRFAVLVDTAKGVPFFISKTDPQGEFLWMPATLDNVAQERAMRFGALLNLNRDFRDLTLDNFGSGNAYIDWNLVQPEKGKWDFSDPDYNIDLAHEHGFSIMANLIWGKNIADWARQDADLHAVMLDYITAVMTHYTGKVDSWSVFNEANRDPNDIFWNQLGIQGVRDAYATARAVDPHARLLYNDFVDLEGWAMVHNPPIIDEVVSQLKQDGTIDGIALQVTGRTQRLDIDKVKAMLETYKQYGLPLIIPEFSVIIEGDNTPENLKQQAQVGAEVITALRACDCVVEVIAFGLEDRVTNKIYKLDNANAGFWLKTETGTYIPKPIVYEMLAVLVADEIR